MPFTFNPFSGDFDYFERLTNPMLFKGAITLASDFPTLASVQTGWFYIVSANVTDNDVTKTNTGQVFLTGEEIVWNGTNWTIFGNINTETDPIYSANTYAVGMNQLVATTSSPTFVTITSTTLNTKNLNAVSWESDTVYTGDDIVFF
jgi:hypothetical protein